MSGTKDRKVSKNTFEIVQPLELLDRHSDWMLALNLCGSGLSRIQHRVNFFQCVGQARGQFFAAAVLLDELEVVGPGRALLVDVGDATNERAEYNLCVVFEKIDLKIKKKYFKYSFRYKYTLPT